MSASLRPTAIHLRQQRKKKRNKLLARIAAGPGAAARAVLEAKVERTYSPFRNVEVPKATLPAAT